MSSHEPRYTRTRRGQAPLRHINGAAGMFYATIVRCSCGQFEQRVNQAPSKGGRKWAEELFDEHLKKVTT